MSIAQNQLPFHTIISHIYMSLLFTLSRSFSTFIYSFIHHSFIHSFIHSPTNQKKQGGATLVPLFPIPEVTCDIMKYTSFLGLKEMYCLLISLLSYCISLCLQYLPLASILNFRFLVRLLTLPTVVALYLV